MPRIAGPSGPTRLLIATAGIVVFLGINAVMYMSRCTSTEFMIDCSGQPGTDTWHVVIIGALVIVGAVATSAGRAFAKGFVGALVVLSVATLGSCTRPWADPVYSVRRVVEPYRARWMFSREHAAMRRDWIAAMNGRSLDVSRGVELAGAVVHCARTYAAANGRVAASPAELARTCRDLEQLGTTVDPGAPVRYVIPVARGESDAGEPIEAVRGDAGWRVSYAATTTGFAVEVSPDAQLTQRWPRIHSDDAMRLQVQTSEDAAPLALTPVADLHAMVECLKGIPAEEERRRAQHGGVTYGWFLTSMAKRLCPAIATRIRAPQPNDENTTLLSIALPATTAASMPVLTYAIEFARRQPAASPFAFDLVARPQPAGLPHYLATFEGDVRVLSTAAPPTPPAR